jgi:hypothetical protein
MSLLYVANVAVMCLPVYFTFMPLATVPMTHFSLAQITADLSEPGIVLGRYNK